MDVIIQLYEPMLVRDVKPGWIIRINRTNYYVIRQNEYDKMNWGVNLNTNMVESFYLNLDSKCFIITKNPQIRLKCTHSTTE